MVGQATLRAADGHELDAWFAGDDASPRGLVVVQEIFGVNPHIRAVCERWAAHGFRVAAPALFDRIERGVALGYDEAGMKRGLTLRAQIEEEAALRDVEAAAHALGASGRPVGVIGFCWGGTLAWWSATRSAAFQAAVGWYGGGIAETRTESPRCPVQLHFGAEDPMIPAADIAGIRDAQPGTEIFAYKGAGHGFGCADRDSYHEAAAAVAEQRSLRFLDAHL